MNATRQLQAASLALVLLVFAPASAGAVKRCDGKRPTIVRGAGSQEIVGTNRADVIVAGGGSDRIIGVAATTGSAPGPATTSSSATCSSGAPRGPGDRLFGGAGNDEIRGDDVAIAIGNATGRSGDDFLSGGKGLDIMTGDHLSAYGLATTASRAAAAPTS